MATTPNLGLTYLEIGQKDKTITINDNMDLIDGLSSISEVNKLTGVNTRTASYTLALSDENKLVQMNVATANNLTVPPNSSVAFGVGTVIHVEQLGVGQTTIVAGLGVTVNTPETLKIKKQHASVSLVKTATDTWLVTGYLEAV